MGAAPWPAVSGKDRPQTLGVACYEGRHTDTREFKAQLPNFPPVRLRLRTRRLTSQSWGCCVYKIQIITLTFLVV